MVDEFLDKVKAYVDRVLKAAKKLWDAVRGK